MIINKMLMGMLLLLCLFNRQGFASRQVNTHISGELKTRQRADTVTLLIHGMYGFGLSGQSNVVQKMVQITRNGRFHFSLPDLTRPVYFSLWTTAKRDAVFNLLVEPAIIPEMLLEPGDNIHINLKNDKPAFTGAGKDKFIWAIESAPLIKKFMEDLTADYTNYPSGWLSKDMHTSAIDFRLGTLEAYKGSMSPRAYQQIKADIIGYELFRMYRNIGGRGNFNAYEKVTVEQVLQWYGEKLYNKKVDTSFSQILADSKYYGLYAYNKLLSDSKYEVFTHKSNVNKATEDLFALIRDTYSGSLRDKVLFLWIREAISSSQIQDSYFQQALSVLETPYFQKAIMDLQKTFGKGQAVLDASFVDNKGKTVRLSDFKGKVVFIDFWFSGCSGCVSVAKAMPHVEEGFKDNPDIVFLSLSIDVHKNTWMSSIDPGVVKNPSAYRYTHYTTPSTRYWYTGGKGSDHEFIKKYVPTNSYPHLLLIGKDQKIYASDPPRPDKNDGKEKLVQLIQEALKQ